MKAIQIHAFGGPEVLTYEDVPCPVPGQGQALIRVATAGVGPWDAWVREGKSVLPQPLPLVPGSDLSGVVEQIGSDVEGVEPGDKVYGVTNARFTGAYAEYALAEAATIARKPDRLGYVEAASLPVVATTAWQMVFDYAKVRANQSVLIQGGGGNVGAYAVQFSCLAGARVIATAFSEQSEYVRSLGASGVINPRTSSFDHLIGQLDVVIDTVGGATLNRSFDLLRAGGTVVSSVAEPDQELAVERGVRALFFLVSVTTRGLGRLTDMIETGKLRTRVGEILPLSKARLAHEMLAGRQHKPGKILLVPED